MDENFETIQTDDKTKIVEDVKDEKIEKDVDPLDMIFEKIKELSERLDRIERQEEEKRNKYKDFFAPVPKENEKILEKNVTYDDIFVKE